MLDELKERKQFIDRVPATRRAPFLLLLRFRLLGHLLLGGGRRALRNGHRRVRLGTPDASGALFFLLTTATPTTPTATRAGTRAPRPTGGLPADRPAHRGTCHPDPTDMWNRFAADQSTFVKEPVVIAVELLEGVVREDSRASLIGDA